MQNGGLLCPAEARLVFRRDGGLLDPPHPSIALKREMEGFCWAVVFQRDGGLLDPPHPSIVLKREMEGFCAQQKPSVLSFDAKVGF